MPSLSCDGCMKTGGNEMVRFSPFDDKSWKFCDECFEVGPLDDFDIPNAFTIKDLFEAGDTLFNASDARAYSTKYADQMSMLRRLFNETLTALEPDWVKDKR